MTRRQFLATLGILVLSLIAARLAKLDATLSAIAPEPRGPTQDPYGQSAYGA